jgi:hypothetical protein
VALDAHDKERVIIEFLLLEGCVGEEIAIRLRNVYGSAAYCRASVFRWISEVRRGNEELRNEGCPGKLYRYESDAAIRPIRQEDPKTWLRMIAEMPVDFARDASHAYVADSPHSEDFRLDFPGAEI